MTGRRHLPVSLLVLVLGAGCSADPPPAPGAEGPGQTLPAAAGFRVELEHREQPAPGPDGAGQLAWESSWRLSWQPVPGAASYAVLYGTNEGADSEPDAVARQPSLTVQAAAGTSPRAALARERHAGLLATSSQLLVSVRPEAGTAQGPPSLWFPVGDVPPDGRPLGTRVLGHED